MIKSVKYFIYWIMDELDKWCKYFKDIVFGKWIIRIGFSFIVFLKCLVLSIKNIWVLCLIYMCIIKKDLKIEMLVVSIFI